jgi:hypothetical protein
MLTSWVFALPLLLAPANPIEIVQGRSVAVLVPFPLGQAANSNPDVVQAVPEVAERRIVFFGRKPGVGDYTVFDARNKKRTVVYTVRVVPADLSQTAEDIRQIVPEGVTVTVAGDRILVEGEVATAAEKRRVEAAVEDRGPEVKNLVTYSQAAVDAAAKTIEQQINKR